MDCPGMSAVVPYRRDNSDLGLWGVSWPVDCPGMSGVVPYRRDNSDLGLWGVSWPVDCPGMSGVVPYRRDNSDLRGNPTLGLVSRMTLGYPCFLGYPRDNFGTLWQSWTTLWSEGMEVTKSRSYLPSGHNSLHVEFCVPRCTMVIIIIGVRIAPCATMECEHVCWWSTLNACHALLD